MGKKRTVLITIKRKEKSGDIQSAAWRPTDVSAQSQVTYLVVTMYIHSFRQPQIMPPTFTIFLRKPILPLSGIGAALGMHQESCGQFLAPRLVDLHLPRSFGSEKRLESLCWCMPSDPLQLCTAA